MFYFPIYASFTLMKSIDYLFCSVFINVNNAVKHKF